MRGHSEGLAAALTDPERLQALQGTGLLDSPPDEIFDRYTRIASRLLKAPTSLVSLVDDHRQFFKSAHGLGDPWASDRETPLTHSFCQYVVLDRERLVVNDARDDERLRDNLAISDIGVIAYAGTPLRANNGQVLGSFCVIHSEPHEWTEEELLTLEDLAVSVNREIELRRIAIALREREQTVRTLLDSTSALIWLLGTNGTLLRANEAALAFIGGEEGDVKGRDFVDLPWWAGDNAQRERVRAAIADASKGRRVSFEVQHQRPGASTVYAEFTVSPVQGLDDVSAIVAESHDVSDRKKVEQLKAEIVGIVSHEIRTPLGATRGALQLLGRNRARLDERDQQVLEMAVRNTDRLLTLVNDLLDLERLEAGSLPLTMETVKAESIATDASNIVRPLADEAGVVVRIDAAGTTVRADAERVLQVVINLVANALRFSPRGSEVLIKAFPDPADATFVRFEIRDQGRGIPAEKQATVFDRFVQAHLADGPRTGSGLGLSISRAIVEQHGGRIWLTSVEGQGSSFFFTIPVG